MLLEVGDGLARDGRLVDAGLRRNVDDRSVGEREVLDDGKVEAGGGRVGGVAAVGALAVGAEVDDGALGHVLAALGGDEAAGEVGTIVLFGLDSSRGGGLGGMVEGVDGVVALNDAAVDGEVEKGDRENEEPGEDLGREPQNTHRHRVYRRRGLRPGRAVTLIH